MNAGEPTNGAVLTIDRLPDGQVVTFTLNRPERLNALNAELSVALLDALQEFDDDPTARVAIVTGAGGRAFSTGGDLKEMAQRVRADSPAFATTSILDMTPNVVERLSKPVIAAIDGYCVAGGLELALGCDIRIATVASRFGLPEVSNGMLAGPALVSLRRNLAAGEALLLHLTGDSMSADRAHQLGLVQELLADRAELLERAGQIAHRIAQHDVDTVARIKRIVRQPDQETTRHQAPLIDRLNAAVARSGLVAGQVSAFAAGDDRAPASALRTVAARRPPGRR